MTSTTRQLLLHHVIEKHRGTRVSVGFCPVLVIMHTGKEPASPAENGSAAGKPIH
jgi:hypothetical protein